MSYQPQCMRMISQLDDSPLADELRTFMDKAQRAELAQRRPASADDDGWGSAPAAAGGVGLREDDGWGSAGAEAPASAADDGWGQPRASAGGDGLPRREEEEEMAPAPAAFAERPPPPRRSSFFDDPLEEPAPQKLTYADLRRRHRAGLEAAKE